VQDAVILAEVASPAIDDIALGMGEEVFDCAFDSMRQQDIVGVEIGADAAARLSKPLVDGVRLTAIRGGGPRHPITVGVEYIKRAIGRTTIEHAILDVRIGLSQDTVNGSAEKPSLVERGGDDGDQGWRWNDWLCRHRGGLVGLATKLIKALHAAAAIVLTGREDGDRVIVEEQLALEGLRQGVGRGRDGPCPEHLSQAKAVGPDSTGGAVREPTSRWFGEEEDLALERER
jgi:hypothetical protein